MSPVEFPQRHVVALQELANRVFESRKANSDPGPIARQLLVGFHDTCTLVGLDRVLGALEATDRTTLAESEAVQQALVDKLGAADLDGGGPRNAKPKMLVDALVAALALTLVEEPDRAIALGDDVKKQVTAAIAAVANVELAAEKLRETVIAEARPHCEERFHSAFNRMAAQLDANGMQLVKMPKIPVDAAQAVQLVLAEARNRIVDRVGRAAIDRAAALMGEAAERIDQPISLRLTPREVAILRAQESRVPKTPGAIARSLMESLTLLVPIAWREPEQLARTYSAKETFAIGELIEHPKFGRGTVVGTLAARIDVEFPDGKVTLVHVPRK